MIVSNQPIAYNKKMKKMHSTEKILQEIIDSKLTHKTISPLPKKKTFSNSDDILFQVTDLSSLEKYKDTFITTEKKLIFFTWVIPSGLGDLAMQIHISSMIHEKNKDLKIELISLVEEKTPLPKGLHSFLPHHILRYSHPHPPVFPPSILTLLKEAFSIIEIPTAYFDFIHFKEMITKDNPHPPVISRIGQYGFIDTPEYNPATKQRSMGLYFLEKGIITLEKIPSKVRDKNTYFAYLITENGIITYFLSILLSRLNDVEPLTIKTPSLGKILPVLQKIDFGAYNVSSLTIEDTDHKTVLSFNTKGKKIHIIQLCGLTPREIQHLMATSHPFVGVRGDGSFTEALSTDALFFYDGLDHALPFLTDLSLIALKELFPYFSLCDYLDQLKNTKNPPLQRAQKIAQCLDCPLLSKGMEKLQHLLYSNYSFNEGLNHLIKKNFSFYTLYNKRD